MFTAVLASSLARRIFVERVVVVPLGLALSEERINQVGLAKVVWNDFSIGIQSKVSRLCALSDGTLRAKTNALRKDTIYNEHPRTVDLYSQILGETVEV